MTFLTKFIDYINNHFWTDSSWFTLIVFFFLFGSSTILLGDNFRQQKLLPATEIEIVADKIELVSNKTRSGRADSNTLRIYIDDELSPKYIAPCIGNVSLSFCDYYKNTVINNAKLKFMILSVRKQYEKDKNYYGNILSLTDANGNLLIKYDNRSVEPTRKGVVNKYFFDLFSVICFLVAFLILLIRIFNKFKKGW